MNTQKWRRTVRQKRIVPLAVLCLHAVATVASAVWAYGVQPDATPAATAPAARDALKMYAPADDPWILVDDANARQALRT